MLDLEPIKARAAIWESAKGFEPLPQEPGVQFECPTCGGDGYLESVALDAEAVSLPAGIQVFGLGEGLTRLRTAVESAPADLAALVAEVERLRVILGDDVTTTALRFAYKSPDHLGVHGGDARDLYAAACQVAATLARP